MEQPEPLVLGDSVVRSDPVATRVLQEPRARKGSRVPLVFPARSALREPEQTVSQDPLDRKGPLALAVVIRERLV